MKHKDFTQVVHPYDNIATTCCYEMEIWGYAMQQEYTEEDIKEDISQYGKIRLRSYHNSSSIYRSKEDALEFLEMIYDDYYEDDEEDILVVYIRQKTINLQMPVNSYLKEWTYDGFYLQDESIVRNCDPEENKFFGRPKEMIRHKIGDIVIVAEGNDAHWGIVYALPPTPDYVKNLNDNALAKGHVYENGSMLDYSDDCYIILTNDGDYMQSHEHILAHHIVSEWGIRVPENVENLLRVGLKKAQGQ